MRFFLTNKGESNIKIATLAVQANKLLTYCKLLT